MSGICQQAQILILELQRKKIMRKQNKSHMTHNPAVAVIGSGQSCTTDWLDVQMW
jgi:lysine/ornithine N-monooxygenase